MSRMPESKSRRLHLIRFRGAGDQRQKRPISSYQPSDNGGNVTVGHAGIQVKIARTATRRPRRNQGATGTCRGSQSVALSPMSSPMLLVSRGGESPMLASPKGEADLTDDRTAQPVVAKQQLVSRGGIEPPTRRLRVCCSAN